MPTMSFPRSLVPAAAVLATVLLASCGKGGDHATQVAAKVGRDEITVSQVNELLTRLPSGADAAQVDEARRNALRNLVHRQLLERQAIEQKLDRDPAVVSALESSRATILAQAYINRVILPQAKPSEEEIHKYFVENPDLFARRRAWHVQEISAVVTPEQQAEVQAVGKANKSLQELGVFLRDHKVPFGIESGMRLSEQLPTALLPGLADLHPNTFLLYSPGPGRVNAIQVIASEPLPLDEKKAAPAIEVHLTNRKREKLTEEDVARLEAAAKVENMGDFARIAAGTPSPAAAPVKPADAANEKDRGISGLR